MKRNIVVCALLTAATMAATGVWAGSGDSFDRPDRDKACCCPEQEGGMAPPHSPEGRIDHMTRRLGLTDEQQTKIKALIRKEREAAGPLLTKLAEYGKQLRAATKSAAFDEAAIRAIADRQARVEVELTVSRARLHNRVKALLTAEQRTLAEKLLPPFQPWQGPRPPGADQRGAGHRPPPPWEEHQQHPDGGDEGEQ